ncbi:MAG: fumarylacetoacetate hydrolase family protein, partial [Cyclobacteriaceae bacterium]
ARDTQAYLKSKGLPWELAKAFNHSAVVSPFIAKEKYDMNNINISLSINNKTVQAGNTSLMLWNIDEIIAFVSKYFTLKTGDIIFTGTPKGVGPIAIGDQLVGTLEDQEMFNFEIK